jgi:hypothetical protein
MSLFGCEWPLKKKKKNKKSAFYESVGSSRKDDFKLGCTMWKEKKR